MINELIDKYLTMAEDYKGSNDDLAKAARSVVADLKRLKRSGKKVTTVGASGDITKRWICYNID